jgi:hypothetical protein
MPREQRHGSETMKELSEEETTAGALAGSSQATCLGNRREKSKVALATAGMAGSGLASGSAGATQQQRQTSFCTQQSHFGSTPEACAPESVWADAIIWSQITVRLRIKAAARFMVSI